MIKKYSFLCMCLGMMSLVGMKLERRADPNLNEEREQIQLTEIEVRTVMDPIFWTV